MVQISAKGSNNGAKECKGEQQWCKIVQRGAIRVQRVQRGAVMVQKSAKGSDSRAKECNVEQQ